MATVTVGFSNDTEAEYEQSQFESMLSAGEIPADAIYWQEGMAEWTSIANYAPSVRHARAPAPAKKRSRLAKHNAFQDESESDDAVDSTSPSKVAGYHYLSDPGLVTLIIMVMIGLNILMVFFDLWVVILLNQGAEQKVPELPELYINAQITYYLVWVMGALSGIAFCLWLYHANRNCHGFGTSGMQFTPNLCLIGFVVPVLNLYWPYQTLKEVYQVSRDPQRWEKYNRFGIVELWWLIQVGTFVALFYLSLTTEKRFLMYQDRTVLTVWIPLCFTFFVRSCLEVYIVLTIARQQDMLVNPGKYGREKSTAVELDV